MNTKLSSKHRIITFWRKFFIKISQKSPYLRLKIKLKSIDKKINKCHEAYATETGLNNFEKQEQEKLEFRDIEEWEDERRNLLTCYWMDKARCYFIPNPECNDKNWKKRSDGSDSVVLTDKAIYELISEISKVKRDRLLIMLTIASTIFGIIGTLTALISTIKN